MFSFLSDEDVLDSLHRFRPRFLAKCDGLPTYYDPYEFGHVCLLESQRHEDEVVIAADDEHNEPSNETKKCCAIPFVASGHFQTINVAEKLSLIVKEVNRLFSCAWICIISGMLIEFHMLPVVTR